MADKSVTIWIREATREELGQRLGGTTPKGDAWRKETFVDVGWEDWVRTRAAFYIGSGPGCDDMTLTSTVDSEPRLDGTFTVDDTEIQLGLGNPREIERGADPVLLGKQLSALARSVPSLTVTPGN